MGCCLGKSKKAPVKTKEELAKEERARIDKANDDKTKADALAKAKAEAPPPAPVAPVSRENNSARFTPSSAAGRCYTARSGRRASRRGEADGQHFGITTNLKTFNFARRPRNRSSPSAPSSTRMARTPRAARRAGMTSTSRPPSSLVRTVEHYRPTRAR